MFEADLSAPVVAAGIRTQNPRELSERVAMGRALWREVVAADPVQRNRVLREVVAPRFRELSAIARAYGKSWKRRHHLPVIDDRWFRDY